MAKLARMEPTPPVDTPAGRYNPLAVRFPQDERDWLTAERERTGESVNSIIVTAVRQYRNRRTAAQKRSQA